MLLENAGIMTHSFRLAERDESTITTNVVSTFLLGLLLLPKLNETALKYNTRPHLTIVSSEVHHYTTIATERKALSQGKHETPFDALSDPEIASMFDRYNVSKLLEVFAVREIVRTAAPSGYPVIVNFVNPGFCYSDLARRENALLVGIFQLLLHARSTEVGSRTLVHAASAARRAMASI
jgi:NAD(P)-dependent dehydrogenase (short-subunit alcohol dehydrogenase family)